MSAMMTAPGDADPAELVADLRAAVSRATTWLRSHVAEDGQVGDPADGFRYYRAPWTFALVGEIDAAHAVCGWMRRNLLSVEGHLDAPVRNQVTDWAYADSAVIIGAHMLQQYDLSIGLMPSLLRWQDPISGGFANGLTPAGGMSDEMDIPYACGPGFACLITGDLAAAQRVARFLRTIYDAQPELPDRFYAFWSRSRQAPIMEADAGFEPRFVVDNNLDAMQRWTIGGIAAAFLVRLYLADPDPGHLELARRYQAFSMAAIDAQFSYPSACKSSWGAALLYQVTGEEEYRAWLGRFARWYLAAQEPEGYWHPWVEESLGDVIQITLEYVMHIQTLVGAVAVRPRGS